MAVFEWIVQITAILAGVVTITYCVNRGFSLTIRGWGIELDVRESRRNDVRTRRSK